MSEPLLSALQKVVFFLPDFKYFLMLFFYFLHPEELAPHAKTDECVPEVYKFGLEFFIIGIFWKNLYKYLEIMLAKAA